MAAEMYARTGGTHEKGPGGWKVEGVPARGAGRLWGQAVAGTLSAVGLAAAAFSVALVLAVPGGTAGATGTHAKTVKISTAKISGVGTVLTTSSGLTLYRFTEDKPGTSTCSGACAKIWPPLLASKGAHLSGPHGVKGLSLMSVGNGHYQVAFHKLPLYRFEGDTKKGQAKGQNVGGVWFAALRSGIPASATTGAPATPTTAPVSSTTQPVTSTTQGSSATSGAGATATPTPSPTPTPATQPTTMVTQPQQPPTTTPPTSPPARPTPTTAPSSGGNGGIGF
jgi:predicted lipoprotein with Yx(FWY)xxD motif